MALELILLDNVPNLGNIGEVVKVSNGYARNYLIPKKLASKATPGILRQLEVKKKKFRAEYAAKLEKCQALADQISSQSITIPMQTGEDDKLYGSVNPQQICDALKEMNSEIDRKQVALPDPIRELGVFPVDIHLHREVTAAIKVWVVKA